MLTSCVDLVFLLFAFLDFSQVLLGFPSGPPAGDARANEEDTPMPWEASLASVFPNTLYRQKKDVKEPHKYIIRTFFLVDKTPKERIREERLNLLSMIERINIKLRTSASFDGYYFEIQPKRLAFRQEYFGSEEDYKLDDHLNQWNEVYRKKYRNSELHAAMLLTKRSFFKKNKEYLNTDPKFNQARIDAIQSYHHNYWKQYKQIYNISARPAFFPNFIPESSLFNLTQVEKERNAKNIGEENTMKDIVLDHGNENENEEVHEEVTTHDDKDNDSDTWIDVDDENDLDNADEDTVSFDPNRSKQPPSHGHTLGIMRGYSICNWRRASGVITGYGDPDFVEEFEGVYVHEFFHGFGLHHDPYFLRQCKGYVMEDGINLAPKVRFSPCSKAAMDYVLPLFPCIYNQHSQEKKEETESKS